MARAIGSFDFSALIPRPSFTINNLINSDSDSDAPLTDLAGKEDDDYVSLSPQTSDLSTSSSATTTTTTTPSTTEEEITNHPPPLREEHFAKNVCMDFRKARKNPRVCCLFHATSSSLFSVVAWPRLQFPLLCNRRGAPPGYNPDRKRHV